LLRRWLHPWTKTRRAARHQGSRHRPRRQAALLHMEQFEDRFHPNDPLGMASTPLLGSGLSLLNAAIKPPERRGKLPQPATLAVAAQVGAGTGKTPPSAGQTADAYAPQRGSGGGGLAGLPVASSGSSSSFVAAPVSGLAPGDAASSMAS